MKNDFQPVVGHRFQLLVATPQPQWNDVIDCESLPSSNRTNGSPTAGTPG